MNRKTLIAVASFALLGILALFALRQPEKGESTGDRERPLAKIDPSALDTIAVTKGGVTTTLKRESGKYKVTAPVASPADDAAAKAAFEALEKLEFGNLVTENKAKHAEFGVEDAKAIHVVAKNEKAAQVLADLFLGNGTPNNTMVRVAGKDDVWQLVGGVRAAFDKTPAEWRDRSVTTFSPADAELVTVKAANGTLVVVKKNGKGAGGDDKWEVVTSAPKIDKLDDAVPNGLVTALSAFKTNDFADGVTPAAAGLDTPALTATVALKGGKNVTLLVGKKKAADETYVKTADAAQIYVVKTFNVERIDKRPADFKDKSLSDVGEADLKEVAVTHGADSYTLVHEGTAWKATKPAKMPLDPAHTPAIGGAFKDWKATGVSDETSPAATGLGKPQAVIVMKTSKGETTTFKVGDQTKDKQSVYLMSSKSPDVYLVPTWTTNRLLPKLEDLKKK